MLEDAVNDIESVLKGEFVGDAVNDTESVISGELVVHAVEVKLAANTVIAAVADEQGEFVVDAVGDEV